MRRFHLLKDLFSLPIIAIILLLATLGNLNAFVAVFPDSRSVAAALTANAWVAPVIAWLSLASAPNWLSGIQIILLIALFERAYRKLRVHYWLTPHITLSASVETTKSPNGVITSARLLARNREAQEITDCAATLETATNLSGAHMTPLIKIRNNRLRWADDQASNDDCQITLPPGSTGSISVAHTLKNFQFTACKASTSEGAVLGLYTVRIHVNGKLMGADIEPQVFDGYLYVEKAKNDAGLTMLFEQGDWKKNKRLRKLRLQSEGKA